MSFLDFAAPVFVPKVNPINFFDVGMTYSDTSTNGVGDPTGVSDSWAALQSMVDGAADGADATHPRRFRFPAGARYLLSQPIATISRNHLTFEGSGVETTYGHSGGAEFISTSASTGTAASIFLRDSGGTASAGLRWHGLTVTGNSGDYATINAGNTRELQMGWGIYGCNGIWIDHCMSQKNKGDGVYLAGTGASKCLNVKVTHSTIKQNGRMGIALIAVDGFTGQYIDFEDICYTAIDYEPNTGANEGAWGEHLWENITVGDYCWDNTFDQPLLDIAPHDILNVLAMNLTIRNVTKTGHIKNPFSGTLITPTWRFGSSFDSNTRTGTLSLTNCVDTSGGETIGSVVYGVADLNNWTGTATLTNNTGFKAAGVNWLKDRGGNGTIVNSGNT